MIKIINNIKVELCICPKCKFKFLREKDMVRCDHKNIFEPLPPEPRIKLTREQKLQYKRDYYKRNRELIIQQIKENKRIKKEQKRVTEATLFSNQKTNNYEPDTTVNPAELKVVVKKFAGTGSCPDNVSV